MASSARQDQAEGESGEEAETNPCLDCPAGCCSFKNINISYKSLDEGQRYDSLLLDEIEEGTLNTLLFEDGEVPMMEWYILTWEDSHRTLSFHCTHQREDGMCGEYDRRPEMCRTFECEALQGEMTLEEFLDSHGLTFDPIESDLVEVREVTERVREIIGRAEF